MMDIWIHLSGLHQWSCAHHLYSGYMYKIAQTLRRFQSPHASEYHISVKVASVRIMSVRSCVVRWAGGVISDLSCTRVPSLQSSKAMTTVYGLWPGIHRNLCWHLAQAINQFACILIRLILMANSDSIWFLPSRPATPNPSEQSLGLRPARRLSPGLSTPALPFGRSPMTLEIGNA